MLQLGFHRGTAVEFIHHSSWPCAVVEAGGVPVCGCRLSQGLFFCLTQSEEEEFLGLMHFKYDLPAELPARVCLWWVHCGLHSVRHLKGRQKNGCLRRSD